MSGGIVLLETTIGLLALTTDDSHQRFYALDGLRGLAALAVVLCHFTQFWGLNWFKNAGSAVDLFFVLSGLVIVHSYGQKIIGGMKFREFLFIRFLRLAPLNIAAILISACTLLVMHQALAQNYKISVPILLKAVFLGSGFVPYENQYSWPYGNYASVAGMFPLNLPAWSLFFEMLAYIICFAYIVATKQRPSVVFCLSCFSIFVVTTIYTQNVNPGWESGHLYLGTARVIGGFFAGALILKLATTPTPLKSTLAVINFIAVFSLFAIGSSHAVMVNIFIVIPVLIWSARSVVVTGLLKKTCVFLGFISYPLYILHIPFVTLLLHQRDFIGVLPSNIRMWAVVFMAIVLAALCGYFDLKLRRAIMNGVKIIKAKTSQEV
jgi:peptidoglycan/LPS O-acetylase OafA/YrhL